MRLPQSLTSILPFLRGGWFTGSVITDDSTLRNPKLCVISVPLLTPERL